MYDPACEELAEVFIDDPPERSRLLKVGYTEAELIGLQRRLAQTIQEAVEGWFAQLEGELEERASRRSKGKQKCMPGEAAG
jgi:hypothetical protein